VDLVRCNSVSHSGAELQYLLAIEPVNLAFFASDMFWPQSADFHQPSDGAILDSELSGYVSEGHPVALLPHKR
jgi:hypothetical protein